VKEIAKIAGIAKIEQADVAAGYPSFTTRMGRNSLFPTRNRNSNESNHQ
jgi:hypothetical protein